MSAFTDQTLNCRDCGTPFIFTVRDQTFYAEKGFTPPTRCKACREINKRKREENAATSPTPVPQIQEKAQYISRAQPRVLSPEEEFFRPKKKSSLRRGTRDRSEDFDY
jgi:hypothetical protein